MASPTVDLLVDGDLVMHDHSEADLGAILDSRYVNVTGDTITPTANSTSTFKVTDQSANAILNIDSTNRVTELTGASTITTLGSELVTNGTFETADNWTFNTNWAFDGTAKTAKHTAGSTATLTQAVTLTNGAIYYVYFQIKTRTAGTVAVSLNGTGAGVNYNSSDTFCPLITAGASGGLVFTPSTDFDGSIDNVSIKLVTRIGNSIALKDAGGTTRIEIRPTQGGNVAIGNNALRHISITTGDNVAIGENTLPVAVNTFRNVAIGSNALSRQTVTSTGYNVGIGGQALTSNETGIQSVAIGYGALQTARYSVNNVAIGFGAFSTLNGRNTDGNIGGNIGIGTQAGQNATTGYNNTIIGNAGMPGLTTGVSNVAIGNGALNAIATTGSNVGIGGLAGYVATGTGGVFIGGLAGGSITSGNYQVALGYGAGGRSAGTGNTYVGGLSGYGNYAAGGSASNNTFLGYETGRANYISNSVLIGYQAGYNETNSDRLYIANSNTATPLIFGVFTGSTAGLTIHSQNTAGIPLTVKGIASQSGNLQNWVNSSGTVLSFVNSSGKFVGTNIGISVGGGQQLELVTYGATAGDVAYINRTLTGTTASGSYAALNTLINSGDLAGTATAITGLNFQANMGTTATTTMSAYKALLTFTGAGTCTTAYGYYFSANTNAAATITNLNGLYIDTILANANGATTTNARGIYVANVSGATNNFAILTNSGNVVFNEGGDSATDFRVESDTEANMLFLDANADTDGALYLGGTTNGIKINKGGELVLLGDATVWEDLRLEPVARNTGAKAPSFVNWFGGLYLYEFDNAVAGSEKEIFFSVQLPHQWKEGTAVEPHIHWVNKSTGTAGHVVRWGIEYSKAKIGDTFSSSPTTVYGTTIAGGGDITTQYEHMLTDFDAISMTGDTISTVIICRLFRDSANAADTFTGTAGLLYIDWHYMIDSLGSKTELAK